MLTFEPIRRACTEEDPGTTGPIVQRTHLDLWGIALAVDLIVCLPLEWATFAGREGGAWTVLLVGDHVVAWRAIRGIESIPPPVARPRDHLGPAPVGELAAWPVVDRHGRIVARRAVLTRQAWEALPLGNRPGGVWSEGGEALTYERPA